MLDFICGWLNSIVLIDYQTMVTLRSYAEVEDRKKCVFKGTKPVTLSVQEPYKVVLRLKE